MTQRPSPEAAYDSLVAENVRLRETIELLRTAQEMEREWVAREIQDRLERTVMWAMQQVGTGVGSALAETAKIRILLAGDDQIEQQGLLAMLQDAPAIAVVGEASSGVEAIQFADTLEPVVVLMDSRLPDMDGLEATRQITKAHPTMAVIIVSPEESEGQMANGLGAGAVGYLARGCSREMLLSAVRSAAQGGAVAEASLLRRTVDGLLRHAVPEPAISAPPVVSLTVREREILGLLAQGHDYATIRRELYLAHVTVKKHVQSIVAKLGVADRTQAALLGVRMGLDRQPDGSLAA